MAIKILPDAFASDPERLARFEREAKTLASLNYPNIAQIYGFEAFRSIQMSGASIEAGPPAVLFEAARFIASQVRGGKPTPEPQPVEREGRVAGELVEAEPVNVMKREAAGERL